MLSPNFHFCFVHICWSQYKIYDNTSTALNILISVNDLYTHFNIPFMLCMSYYALMHVDTILWR